MVKVINYNGDLTDTLAEMHSLPASLTSILVLDRVIKGLLKLMLLDLHVLNQFEQKNVGVQGHSRLSISHR